jgi:DNA invertase Pin-like site-specific DNA recombinase
MRGHFEPVPSFFGIILKKTLTTVCILLILFVSLIIINQIVTINQIGITMEKNYVSYLRVSTTRQSNSGLGLEAQKIAVTNCIDRNGDKLIAEFCEVESGGNNTRPKLMAAIDLCQKENATLIVAKLDRLSRNLHFVSSLMESKVKFFCCDLPDANNLTIHIFSAMAEFERKRISERICEALNAKREREPDWIAGSPENLTGKDRIKGNKAVHQNAMANIMNRQAAKLIIALRRNMKTWAEITRELNSLNFKTREGKIFHQSQVKRLHDRFIDILG